jgi:predicted transposase/invertase (TIGR01784 family)
MTEWSTEVAMRVSREEGIEEGIERGIERGEAKKQREIAEKLLKLHAPLDMVLEATGLPLAYIQTLQTQLS